MKRESHNNTQNNPDSAFNGIKKIVEVREPYYIRSYFALIFEKLKLCCIRNNGKYVSQDQEYYCYYLDSNSAFNRDLTSDTLSVRRIAEIFIFCFESKQHRRRSAYQHRKILQKARLQPE